MQDDSLLTEAPDLLKIRTTAEKMILSASGWRAVFAADQDEESTTSEVPDALLVLAGLAAHVFAQTMQENNDTPTVVIGTDTRPTGPLLEKVVSRVLCARNVRVRSLGVASTPEIIAYANQSGDVDGFLYISASHNPIGHNGLKMGAVPGGVAGGEVANLLIQSFTALISSATAVEEVVATLGAAQTSSGSVSCAERVRAERGRWKKASLQLYSDFVRETMQGPGRLAHQLLEAFVNQLKTHQVTIVGDLNGSARAESIDKDFLYRLGVNAGFINDIPGVVAHQIVPEGVGLEQCRLALETRARRDPAAAAGPLLGYVPDNDGDRGNLVYYNVAESRARVIDAQSVFALACVAELAWLEATGALTAGSKTAIVVNGPTSLRVDRIATLFGVEVIRAEVGEANVLNAADELRERGYLVRLTGEGSNGGTIVYPSLVRDPLNTITTILKLLVTPPGPDHQAPAHLWAQHLDIELSDSWSPSLDWIVSSLPCFTTTSAYEDRAIMPVGTATPAVLKQKFEAAFPTEFASRAELLSKELGVTKWEIVNYEGTTTRRGAGNRTGSETGGLKVSLLDDSGADRGFLWMRGSKTEPVFRVMVDLEGDKPELERALLIWLRSMVEHAGS